MSLSKLFDLDGPIFLPLVFLTVVAAVIGVSYKVIKDHRATNKSAELVVTVTAYRPIKAQTDSSPNWTSVGTPAIMGICAASRDLLESGQLNYGDIVSVPKLGVYKVMDTMNARHKKHIDILVYTKAQERIVGWRKQVLITKVNANDRIE